MIAYGSVKSEPRVLSAAVMLQGRQHAQCRAHMLYVPGSSGPAGVVTVQLKKLCWKHPSFPPYACGYKFRFGVAMSGLSRPCNFSCKVCCENGERQIEQKQMVKWEGGEQRANTCSLLASPWLVWFQFFNSDLEDLRVIFPSLMVIVLPSSLCYCNV